MKQDQGSSINAERQKGPHAHCIVLDPANRFAYACDLGTDKIMIFRFDKRRGKLIPNESPWVQAKPGAGPRHLTFHPAGKYAYVINELHATVTAFAVDPRQGQFDRGANRAHLAERTYVRGLGRRYSRFSRRPISLLFQPRSRQYRRLQD